MVGWVIQGGKKVFLGEAKEEPPGPGPGDIILNYDTCTKYIVEPGGFFSNCGKIRKPDNGINFSEKGSLLHLNSLNLKSKVF